MDEVPSTSWDEANVVKAFKSRLHQLKPEAVLAALDHEDFAVKDARGLLLLCNAWKELSGDKPFPVEVFSPTGTFTPLASSLDKS